MIFTALFSVMIFKCDALFSVTIFTALFSVNALFDVLCKKIMGCLRYAGSIKL